MRMEISEAIGTLMRFRNLALNERRRALQSGTDTEIMQLDMDINDATKSINALDSICESIGPQHVEYVGGE